MTIPAIIMMIITLTGYFVSFGICMSKVFTSKAR